MHNESEFNHLFVAVIPSQLKVTAHLWWWTPNVFQGSQKDRTHFKRNSSRLLLFLLDFEQGTDDKRQDLVTASMGTPALMEYL